MRRAMWQPLYNYLATILQPEKWEKRADGMAICTVPAYDLAGAMRHGPTGPAWQ